MAVAGEAADAQDLAACRVSETPWTPAAGGALDPSAALRSGSGASGG